jgi:hypothetical protein
MAAPAALAADDKTLPARVDLRPQYKKLGLTPRGQGARDTCSLFAVTALAEFEAARKEAKGVRLSEEFLVWAANEATGLGGDQAMFYEALHGLRVLGICTEERMIYEAKSDAKRKPSARALADARARRDWAVHWIKRWNVKTGLGAEQLRAIKAALAAGHPVAVGMRWPKRLVLKEGVIQTPPESGVVDGHSVALVGYQDDDKRPGGGLFVLRNSFGANWGDGGHASISYAYAAAYVNDAVWLEAGKKDPNATGPTLRLEAEEMAVKKAVGCTTATQDMREWGGKMWGGGKQLFCRGKKGASLELSFRVKQAGTYRLALYATMAPDFGRVELSVNGKRAGGTIDLYAPRVMPTDALPLGVVKLAAGEQRLGVVVESKNDASTGHLFGLDSLELTPLRE